MRDVVGRYRITEQVLQKGDWVLSKGWDPLLGRAVLVLFAREGAAPDATTALTERAGRTASLSDSAWLRLLDVASDRSGTALVLECPSGDSLGHAVQKLRGPQVTKKIAEWLVWLLEVIERDESARGVDVGQIFVRRDGISLLPVGFVDSERPRDPAAALRALWSQCKPLLLAASISVTPLEHALEAPLSAGIRDRLSRLVRATAKSERPKRRTHLVLGAAIVALTVAGGVYGVTRTKPQGHADVTILARPWAYVLVDGTRVDTTPLPGPLRLSPGKHTVELRHPTYGMKKRELVLTAGMAETIDEVFDAPAGVSGASSSQTPPVPSAQ